MYPVEKEKMYIKDCSCCFLTISYSSVMAFGSSCLWNHIMYFVWNLQDCFFRAFAAKYCALVPYSKRTSLTIPPYANNWISAIKTFTKYQTIKTFAYGKITGGPTGKAHLKQYLQESQCIALMIFTSTVLTITVSFFVQSTCTLNKNIFC